MAERDQRDWFVLSAETKAVLAVFDAMPPGRTVSYADLARLVCQATGRAAFDPQGADYARVASARRIMRARRHRVFDIKAAEGVRHLTDEEVARTKGGEGIRRARNAARRTGQKLDTVDLNACDLDQQEKATFQAERQLLDLIEQQARGAARRRAADLPLIMPPAKGVDLDGFFGTHRRKGPGGGTERTEQ